MKILTAAIVIISLGVGMWIAAGQSILTQPLSSRNTIAGYAIVIDGDTIDVAGVRVRLEGIDAPETDQRCRDKEGRDYLCGVSATNGLKALIGGDPVSCRRSGKDTYGRTLAVCSGPNGKELNSELVRLGLAVAFRRYSDRYAAVEDAARSARDGLWAGSFEHPAAFEQLGMGAHAKIEFRVEQIQNNLASSQSFCESIVEVAVSDGDSRHPSKLKSQLNLAKLMLTSRVAAIAALSSLMLTEPSAFPN
jgi:endonuclease YncB( thermonuclease family)